MNLHTIRCCACACRARLSDVQKPVFEMVCSHLCTERKKTASDKPENGTKYEKREEKNQKA